MDDLVSPPTTEAALQQCLAEFSADLSARYMDDKQLPKRDGHVLEYLGQRKGGGHCYIGIRSYPEPLTPWELDQQRVLLERIRQTRHAMLATMVDQRLESHGHYMVSGPVGAAPLHDYLRQHRSVSFSVVCDFISLLAEALEAAREARWPRCNIEPYSLLLGELSEEGIRKGVCLPVPVLPGLELRNTAVPALPTTTQVYVPELARLVCQMLGSPQQQRYRPIAKVGAVTNQLLRFVLEQQWQGHIDNARTFAIALRKTAEESNRVLSGRPDLQGSDSAASVPPEATPLHRGSASTTAVATATVIMPPPVAASTALRSLKLPVAGQVAGVKRLRLRPSADSGKSVKINLCLTTELTVGRAATVDHSTRFFPESTRNTERTLQISRAHLKLILKGADECWATESAEVNQSFVGGQPLGGKYLLGSYTRLSVAGQYDLDIRKLPSWWPKGMLWDSEAEQKQGGPSGAILLCPTQGMAAVDESTLWLFTDAAFGIGEDGVLDLMPASVRDVIGWFVRGADAVYVVTAESDGVVRLAGLPLQAQQPQQLKVGDILRVGSVDLVVTTDLPPA